MGQVKKPVGFPEGRWVRVSACKRCGLKIGFWKYNMLSDLENGKFRCKGCGEWREKKAIFLPSGTILVTEEKEVRDAERS